MMFFWSVCLLVSQQVSTSLFSKLNRSVDPNISIMHSNNFGCSSCMSDRLLNCLTSFTCSSLEVTIFKSLSFLTASSKSSWIMSVPYLLLYEEMSSFCSSFRTSGVCSLGFSCSAVLSFAHETIKVQ
jgi:hypothetical protein